MKPDRLTLSEDRSYPPPRNDLEIRVDQFLNRWQWRCPTLVARAELLELIEWTLDGGNPTCPLLVIEEID